MNTNTKGQIAQSRVELRAIEKGYIVSRPIFDTRYDLVIDDGKKFKKIQIKYGDGKKTKNSILVELRYKNRKGKVSAYKKGEVDYLAVYIPKIDDICLFPQKIFVNKGTLSVRILNDKPRVNGAVLAEKYIW